MPQTNAYAAGGQLSAGAFATRRFEVVLGDNAETPSLELLCPGMSRITFWIFQAAGLPAALFRPQFMVRAHTGVGAPQDEFLDLRANQFTAPGFPLIINEQIVAVKTRLLFTRPLNIAVTIQYVLTCSA